MRLGQLARKLSLRPTQIIEFLALQNIKIEESSNTRMEESHVVLVVQNYAPESLVNIVAEADEIEVEEREEPNAIEDTLLGFKAVEQSDVPASQLESVQEVIRVPKIELSGLKVLGKIELPEQKKKDQTNDEQSVGSVTTEVQPARQLPKSRNARGKSHHKSERSNQQSRRNPLELQREREAKESEERRKIALEREKEKRKRHYEEKVKAVAQAKRVKPVKVEPKEETKLTPRPTTWIGKFLGWWIRE